MGLSRKAEDTGTALITDRMQGLTQGGDAHSAISVSSSAIWVIYKAQVA